MNIRYLLICDLAEQPFGLLVLDESRSTTSPGTLVWYRTNPQWQPGGDAYGDKVFGKGTGSYIPATRDEAAEFLRPYGAALPSERELTGAAGEPWRNLESFIRKHPEVHDKYQALLSHVSKRGFDIPEMQRLNREYEAAYSRAVLWDRLKVL